MMIPSKPLTRISLALILAFGLTAFSENKEEKKLISTMKNNQIGSTEDVWLEKRVIDGSWAKVALIFGYAGDYTTCLDISHLYTLKYPLAEYRCVPAN